MDIQFVAQIDASADVVAFPVRKGEAGALGALLGAAAAASSAACGPASNPSPPLRTGIATTSADASICATN
jgi:hypothetical protein